MKDLPMVEIYKLYKGGYTYRQVADMYNVSRTLVMKKIKKYCTENNIEYVSNARLRKKLNVMEVDLYKLYKEGNTLKQIADKYEVSTTLILREIKKYCSENNIEYIPNKRVTKKKELPSANLYKLYKEKNTLKQIAEKYNVSPMLVLDRIKGYCTENNIEYIPNKKGGKRLDISPSDVYRLYKEGYSQKELAIKYNVAISTINSRIYQYRYENGIKCWSHTNKYKTDISQEEVYKLYKEGYSQKELAIKYNTAISTINSRIHQYYRKNKIAIMQQQDFPIHKIYYQYINGTLIEELTEIYNIEESALMQKLYEYCTENNIYITKNKLNKIKNKQILLYHLKNILKTKTKKDHFNDHDKIKSK